MRVKKHASLDKSSRLTASEPTCHIRDPGPFDPGLYQLGDLGVDVATKQSLFDLCIELDIARSCLRGGRRIEGESGDDEIDDRRRMFRRLGEPTSMFQSVSHSWI